MFTNKSEKITFSYNASDVFNDICLMSAYMAKSLSNDAAAIDEFSITEDERELYNVCVKQALPNIYEVMVKMSMGIDNAFSSDVKVEDKGNDPLNREVGTYIELNVANNNAYNSNALSIVDSTINDCIKYGVLAEFYTMNINIELQKIAQSKLNNSLSQLKNRLFQLKKKTMSSLL